MFTAMDAVREARARYKHHQPELILLYQIVVTYNPEFLDYMESQGMAVTAALLVDDVLLHVPIRQ